MWFLCWKGATTSSTRTRASLAACGWSPSRRRCWRSSAPNRSTRPRRRLCSRTGWRSAERAVKTLLLDRIHPGRDRQHLCGRGALPRGHPPAPPRRQLERGGDRPPMGCPPRGAGGGDCRPGQQPGRQAMSAELPPAQRRDRELSGAASSLRTYRGTVPSLRYAYRCASY